MRPTGERPTRRTRRAAEGNGRVAYAVPEGAALIEAIGAGSVFDVALVRERGRALVCKRLSPRALRSVEGRAAMVREARFLSLGKHAALPELVRVGSDGHGPFVIETRVEGAPVRALVEGWRARGRRVPPGIVAHLGAESAAALAEIHELCDGEGPLGLSHGDLGPDHVILGPLGEARFVDFGAARFRGLTEGLETGDRGTLPWVAPEVARGEAAPGAAADVYALAATLLWLAAGGEPLADAREEAAMLLEIGERGVRRDLLAKAEGLSDGARAAIGEALEKDPAARLGSARALATALARR
jgi:eukaryotic-like serine/threonine-protein kinase